MRIAQLTDLHIGRIDDETHGVDVRTNFLNILAEVAFAKVDHLVLTGDLCLHHGDEIIYKWIKARLDKLAIPYSILAGNHDNASLMWEVFEMNHVLDQKELYYARRLGKQTCLFLDNSCAGHSDNQLKWLKRQLKQAEGTLIIFSHYPILEGGVLYMDQKHRLEDMDHIQPLLFDYKDPIYLFCGHYHVERAIHQQNIHQYITPSCYVQIHPDKSPFEVDHHRIALRLIEWNNANLHTSVRYIDGQRL